MKKIFMAGCAAAAFLAFAAPASAADLSDRWQFVGSVGGEVRVLHFDNATIDQLVANGFYGIGANAGVCYGAFSHMGLCAEAVGFFSLGSASEAARIAGIDVTTESDMRAIGLKVSAPISMGRLTLSPYLAAERVNLKVKETSLGTTTSTNDTDWAYSLGGNAKFFFTEKAGLELQGQYGFGDFGTGADYKLYGARAALAVRF